MSSENPFIAPLGKLALSLGASPDSAASTSPAAIPPQLSQRRQICIITLLRIVDNILDDPEQLNPKLRKIKVSNPAFHKRCGQWDGSIEFLLKCGFSMKGGSQNNSSRHLRLDVDDREMLLYGREMLVQFAVLTLGVDETSLPRCPTQVVMQRMEGSHTDVSIAAAEKSSSRNGGTSSKANSSAPTIVEDTIARSISTTSVNESIREHPVEGPNVVPGETSQQAIDSATLESLAAKNTLQPTTTAEEAAANSISERSDLDQAEISLIDKEVTTESHTQQKEETTTSADEMMTTLLNEIEAELNDDFFSTTIEGAVLSMSESEVTLSGNPREDASPNEDSVSMRSGGSASNIVEECDELAMAIAMSLDAPGSDKDEKEEEHVDNDEEKSNNMALSGTENNIPSLQSDLEPRAKFEEMSQPSGIAETDVGKTSLTRQEKDDYDKATESPLITSDVPNLDDSDKSCKENVEVKLYQQQHHYNEENFLNDKDPETESTQEGNPEEASGLSGDKNNLKSSFSSVKTLQVKNTSRESDNKVAVVVNEDNEANEFDKPPSNIAQSSCASVFSKISIPEGEFASSNDEDAKIFRLGFELCNQSLFSIWLSSGQTSLSGVSNLHRWRKGETSDNCDPVILIPIHIVYAVWTYILGLKSRGTHLTSDVCRSQAGSMYSWIVTSAKELATLDDIPIRDMSMNIHTNLSETDILVCNYVLNALREIELVDVYGGNFKDSPSSDTTFFIGIERNLSDEYTNNNQASNLFSEPIIRQCHDILAQIVHPTVLDQLNNNDTDTASKSNSDQILLWYAAHHAPRHLIATPQIDDAKAMLLNPNFIQARIRCLGYLEGTKQHCKDCEDFATALSKSNIDLKREQLQTTCRTQNDCAKSPEDYDDDDYPQQAPELTEWTESRVKALCAVSSVLRKQVGEISDFNQDDKVELGNAFQEIGEAIGDTGIYRVEELEIYDEALQLKSQALGSKHEKVAETLFAMGCHHQRFQHAAFAQRCYEQALAIYKARLGYEDPRVARVLHNIGVMYHSKNEITIAMKCFTKSLSIRKAALGDNDISVAESYCWIGNMHRESEEFEAARESFLAAHQIKSLVLGKVHSECAEILHNIGVVCDDLGLYSDSLSSFREALMIRKANVSSGYNVNEMSDICDTLNCIANVYRAKMDRQHALQFFEQSLKNRTRIVSMTVSDDEQVTALMSTYKDVIALLKIELKESTDEKSKIYGKIGSLYFEMAILYNHRLKKLTEALTYFLRSLRVFKQTKDLTKIGQVLSHMASIHVKRNDNQKALKCYRDALFLEKKAHEGDSLQIADSLHNIGNCEAKGGEFRKSLDTYAEALQMKKNMLPSEHLSIAKTEHCIGLAHLQVGNFEKALGYFLSSMKTRRSQLGDDHLDVSFSLHSIGRIYFYQERYDDAIDCVEQALKIKGNALHDRHISLAETQHLLGSLLIKRSNFSSALPLLKAALITYKGKEDCEVMKSDVLDLLANSYMNNGDNQYSILSLEQSLKIKTEILGPDDLACANVLMILGKLKAKMENFNGALVAFKEVKRIQKQVYGKDHLKNADLLVEVAAIQKKLGNSDMAFRCYTEALRIRQSQLYINSPEIAEVLVSLGKIHQMNDDHVSAIDCFEEAADIYSKKQNCSELENVYYLLGTSQLGKGDSNGLASLEKCLQSREQHYGTNSDEWAEVAYDVGIAKLKTDETSEGVLLLEKFVQIVRRSEKGSSERLSNALLELGKIYRKTRSIDEAMELFDEALQMQTSQDENELWKSEVLLHKGSIFESRKQYMKSLSCYEESLQLRKSVVGEDEVTADTMKRVGEIHRLRGSYDQALEQFESALDVYRMTVGNNHESVADTLHCLGYIHDSKNDSEKALSYHKEAWSVRKTVLGKEHVKVASSLDDIAGIYQKLGENVKAIRSLKEALRLRKLILGDDDMEVATTLFGLGICCAAINETPKAMECYNRALKVCANDDSNPKLEAQALHQIGCVHASTCSYREALQSWRTSLSKYREAGLADDHYMVACTLGNIEMAENVLSSG